jgi:hypothetical protein
LEVVGTKRTELRGHYWTDRKTRGEMICAGRVKTHFYTFSEASEFIQKIDEP